MTSAAFQALRAQTYDEIKPLIDLCRAGRLFEVQEWIAAGKPVNVPLPANRRHGKPPLEIAIDLGFHSLVKVLLEGGAAIEADGWYCPMDQALQMRRFDIVQLLVEHGYDPRSVDMELVFHTWKPEIMEYFIDRGAEVEAGNPLASALCSRIRTALRILKRYQDRFPSFQEQANIALRFHCKEGNLKWVSLMLWAEADPYAPGDYDPRAERDPDDPGLAALAWAALYDHFEVFGLKKLRLDVKHPVLREVMQWAYKDQGAVVLKKLLDMGMDPNDQENGGCLAIQSLLRNMDWVLPVLDSWGGLQRVRKNIDTDEARDKLKAIHILAKYGAKWVPKDKDSLDTARRSLLKLIPDYTVEFVWIMSKYKACSKDAIEGLLRTPSIKSLISGHSQRVNELLSRW